MYIYYSYEEKIALTAAIKSSVRGEYSLHKWIPTEMKMVRKIWNFEVFVSGENYLISSWFIYDIWKNGKNIEEITAIIRDDNFVYINLSGQTLTYTLR